jgi:purine/pyrimidine-nucleoside phosphorylase
MSDTISHNSYFEGKVQSLGLDTPHGKATVGVMLPGKYKFGTSTKEHMVIVSGVLNVNLHDAEWKLYRAQESFYVDADASFYVSCDEDVAYICYYS